MQVIRTNSFKQSRLEFSLQVISTYFRTRWVFVLMLFAIAASQFALRSQYANLFLGLAFLFPVMISLFLYFVTGAKNLRWYYAEKALRIDEGGFKMDFADGRKERVKWDQVKKLKKLNNAYQIFNDPPLFMTVPFDVFNSEADRLEFERILKEHKLLLG
jgi:hypothetical protein